VIASAAHHGPGHAHAEADALSAIDGAGTTLYVTLEPCNHHGRTGPCCETIVAAGVSRVVVAMEDPDPRVSGRGIEYLRRHGVEVKLGVLEEEARKQNAAYVCHRTTGRPLVTLKLALTLDGRLAAPDGSARWITGPETRHRVHARRATADAILVGAGTIVVDDPSLTARNVGATHQPLRVVVDSSGRTAAEAAVFGSDGDTLIATTDKASYETQLSWKEAGAEVIVLPSDRWGVDMPALLDVLGHRGVLDLYCEGGAGVATTLLRQNLVDRLELHYAPKLVGRGGPDIGDIGVTAMTDAQEWATTDVIRSDDDVLLVLERAGI
jgi:diaminohydroxyphosphoribosylaminopyrimidine deaminase / 5-amino-6-(5-phosphoribosylamino)uracil reductase